MSELIDKYYKSYGIVPVILKQKLTKLDKHPDIAKEFEVWIQTGEYKDTDCVEEHGYTARKLAETFRLLKGDGAYFMLIELREHPQAALSKLRKGIKLK